MYRSDNKRKSGSGIGLAVARWSTGFALVWLAVASVAIVADQIRQLPPRPPTKAERASATPGAQAKWNIIHARIAQRLTYAPPEFGAFWSSRSGRICGVVTRLNAGVYFREQFYTEQLTPFFAKDDQRRFFRSWLDCVGDHWVDLRRDSDGLGFCAVPRNQNSVIAEVICRPSAKVGPGG